MNFRNISLVAAVVIVIALVGFVLTANNRDLEATDCLSGFTAVAAGTTVTLDWNLNLSTGQHCRPSDVVVVRWNLQESTRAQRIANVGISRSSYTDSGLEPGTQYVYRVKTKHSPPSKSPKRYVTTGTEAQNPVPTPVPATPTPRPTATPWPTATPLPAPLMDDYPCVDRVTNVEEYAQGSFEKCNIRHLHGDHPVHVHQVLITYSISGTLQHEVRHYESLGSHFRTGVIMSAFEGGSYQHYMPNNKPVSRRNPNFHSHHENGQNVLNLQVFEQYTPGAPNSGTPDSAFECYHDSINERQHAHPAGNCYHVLEGGPQPE